MNDCIGRFGLVHYSIMHTDNVSLLKMNAPCTCTLYVVWLLRNIIYYFDYC